MAVRRSSFQKKIDTRSWDTTLHGQITALDLAEGAIAIGDLGATFTAAAVTILRIRGRLIAQLDAGAVDERASIAVGIIIVTTRAFNAGSGSMPLPQDNGENQWIWHDYVQLTSGAEVAANDTGLIDRVVIDSKAMRKMKGDETLAFMAQVADSVDGGGTVDMMYGVRFLFGF